jgi:hypothetical protein
MAQPPGDQHPGRLGPDIDHVSRHASPVGFGTGRSMVLRRRCRVSCATSTTRKVVTPPGVKLAVRAIEEPPHDGGRARARRGRGAAPGSPAPPPAHRCHRGQPQSRCRRTHQTSIQFRGYCPECHMGIRATTFACCTVVSADETLCLEVRCAALVIEQDGCYTPSLSGRRRSLVMPSA